MKNKFFKNTILALILCFSSLFFNTAEAKTYKIVAYSLDKISTIENMPQYITLKIPSQTIDGGKIHLENEAMLRVKITEINQAKRGKRDGYIMTKLIAYSVPSQGNKAIDVSNQEIELKIKRYVETDYKGLAQTAATTVVSHVVGIPFLNQGVEAVKGAVKPIEGKSRAKSAGIKAYESSPLSYFNKGKELNVSIGEKLTVSFKSEEPEDKPNYEYTTY